MPPVSPATAECRLKRQAPAGRSAPAQPLQGVRTEDTAVTGPDPLDIPFDALALAPLDASPANAPVAGVADTRATFRVDTRSGKDRRVHADRREEFRLTPDRRSGRDRRPRRTWEPGHNL